MIKVQKIIKRYANKNKKTIEEEKEEVVIISAQDIVLNQFVWSPDYKDHFDEQAQQ